MKKQTRHYLTNARTLGIFGKATSNHSVSNLRISNSEFEFKHKRELIFFFQLIIYYYSIAFYIECNFYPFTITQNSSMLKLNCALYKIADLEA